MDGQLAIVGILIVAAVAYLARSSWRTFAGKKAGCGSGCGMCAVEPEAKPGRIALPRVE